MKGVILGRAPGVTIVDVTHGIPPQDVVAGALVLRHALPWFAAGAVHVAVVDPGVGGPRRPLCVETAHGLLVGPDNGLLSLAAAALGVRRIVHLTAERFFLTPRSATFHGRDVFAPVAAALAPVVGDMDRVDVPAPRVDAGGVRGEVVYVDHFGNLVTNVDAGLLPPGGCRVRIGGTRIDGVAASYTAVAPGAPVAVVNSWGLLEVAVRDGRADVVLGLRRGAPIRVEGFAARPA